LATGAAMSSKFSGAILPIVLIAFCLARIFAARDRRKQAIAEVRFLAIAGVSALMVIEATYLFSVWPWTYVANMRSVNANHNPDHLFYLFGSFSRTGCWYYFPLAFAVKATIPLLLATTLALAHFFIKRFNDVWAGDDHSSRSSAMYRYDHGADDLGVGISCRFSAAVCLVQPHVLDLNNDARAWRCSFFCVWGSSGALGFPNYIPYVNEIAGREIAFTISTTRMWIGDKA
jgi:hypothetical protein